MSAILQSDSLKTGLRVGFETAKAVWGWIEGRLWPIYSTAIVVCVFNMIAVSSEKQILADHYFGNSVNPLAEDKDTLVRESKKLFNEEVTLAIKEKVWQLPDGAFKREYADRHGSL